MAYENRLREIQPAFQLPHAGLQSHVTSGVTSAFEYRSKQLEVAVNMLENASTSNLNLRDQWVVFLQDASKQIVDRLTRVSTDTLPIIERIDDPAVAEAVAHITFWVRGWATTEGSVVSKFKNMKFAQVRDMLVDSRRLYEIETDHCHAKLSQIRSSIRSIHSDARTARDALVRACDTAVRELRDEQRDLTSYLSSAVGDESKLKQIPGEVSEYVGNMVSELDEFNDQLSRQFTKLMGAEIDLITMAKMLVSTRSRANLLVEGRNFDGADERVEEVENISGAQLSTLQWEGDKRDLIEFVTNSMVKVRVHLESFRSVYDPFIDDFEGVFVYEISSSTMEEFLQAREWESWAGNIRSLYVPRFLNELGDAGHDNWGVSLRDVPFPEKENIERALRKEAQRLGVAISGVIVHVANLPDLADQTKLESVLNR